MLNKGIDMQTKNTTFFLQDKGITCWLHVRHANATTYSIAAQRHTYTNINV